MKLYHQWVDKNIADLSDKIFIVTGANIGIGYYISYYLAYKKATVIMACRNLVKAEKAKENLLKILPEAKLDILPLDVSSLESIQNFQKEYQKKYQRCHGFIHNAGVYHIPQTLSKDGYEMVMATNYLGVYALTRYFLPLLKQTKDSRLVFTTSISHRWYQLDFQDFFSEKKYKSTAVYGKSKLAIASLFVYLSSQEKDIKICIAHPGISSTNLLNSDKGGFSKTFSKIGTTALKLFVHSPAKAALSAVFAAGNEKVQNKDIYGPRGILEISGFPKKRKLSKKAYQNAEKLIEYTEKLLHLERE